MGGLASQLVWGYSLLSEAAITGDHLPFAWVQEMQTPVIAHAQTSTLTTEPSPQSQARS